MLWLDVELLCHAPFQSFIVMESKGAFSCKLHKRWLGIFTIWPPVDEQGVTWGKGQKKTLRNSGSSGKHGQLESSPNLTVIKTQP